MAHRLTEPEPPQIGAEAEILKESSAAEQLPLTTIYVKGKTRWSVADVSEGNPNSRNSRTIAIAHVRVRSNDVRVRT